MGNYIMEDKNTGKYFANVKLNSLTYDDDNWIDDKNMAYVFADIKESTSISISKSISEKHKVDCKAITI